MVTGSIPSKKAKNKKMICRTIRSFQQISNKISEDGLSTGQWQSSRCTYSQQEEFRQMDLIHAIRIELLHSSEPIESHYMFMKSPKGSKNRKQSERWLRDAVENGFS